MRLQRSEEYKKDRATEKENIKYGQESRFDSIYIDLLCVQGIISYNKTAAIVCILFIFQKRIKLTYLWKWGLNVRLFRGCLPRQCSTDI